jgi:hypothetical protein
MDLLTTHTHDSELHVTTALSLISTFYKSLLQTLNLLLAAVSSLEVPWQRLLTVEILQLHALKFFVYRPQYRPAYSTQIKVKITLRLTVSQSVSHGVEPPTWGSWPNIYYCLTITVLLLWGALSEENTGLTYSTEFAQLSLSLMLRPTVSRPVCLGIKHPSGACDQIFISARNTE